MQVVQRLEDLTPWCNSAQVGDNTEFSVVGEVNQADASRFAGEINRDRGNHIWITVKELGCVPDPVTKIEVRCSI